MLSIYVVSINLFNSMNYGMLELCVGVGIGVDAELIKGFPALQMRISAKLRDC